MKNIKKSNKQYQTIKNRRALFDFEIKEKFEAGLELFGHEVKAISLGRGDLTGAYIIIKNKQAWLKNAYIPAYQKSNTSNDFNERRDRRLLLSKKEILELSKIYENKKAEKGLTIVPISIYKKNRFYKIEVAIGQGKKKYDKRQSINKRESQRIINRIIKNQR